MRVETSPDDFHGMAVAEGILTARGGATSHAAVVARQIGKPCVAGCAELVVDYATKSAPQHHLRPDVRRGRLDQRRRLDRRGLPLRAADRRGPVRGPAGAAAGPGLGRRDPPDAGLGQRRQARGGRPGPQLRRPGHRPLPDRAHVPRGRAPRDRAWRDPRRQRRHPRQGEDRRRRGARRPTRPRRVATVRRRDGQARGPPAGRLRGDPRRDERPAGRHPPDRPAAPRVPPEPRGAARQGDQGGRRRDRRGQGAPRHHQVDARAEPDAGAPRLPPRADDPGLREDPDPRHPQRRRGGEARRQGPAARRS